MSSLVGTRIAQRYRIAELIGCGGMGDVYRGTDLVLARPVAVKVLSDPTPTSSAPAARAKRSAESLGIRRRFLREARSMAALNHRGIVAVYDAGEADGVSYIVMELVRGRTMREVSLQSLGFEGAVRAIIELLEALKFAHEHNVIHRDIKPGNVMVLADGSVKVMDFGLCLRTSDISQASQAGEIAGTIAYLPPERFLGKPADPRGDLYSVGVVMYELFTGVVPFKSDADDLVAVIFAHVNDLPMRPRTINPEISPELERIIMKLLEKDPEKRYASAAELIGDLQGLCGEGAPGAANGRAGAVKATAAGAAGVPRTDAVDPRMSKVLDTALAPTRKLNDAFGNVLAGMLATRRRDYEEAGRRYLSALQTLKEMNNGLEFAKTAIKYAMMSLQKNREALRPEREEIRSAMAFLFEALPFFRSRQMTRELEEGERTLYELQRLDVTHR